MKLFNIIENIESADLNYATAAKAKWDSIAKPLGSLGLLEEVVIQICGATRSLTPDISKRTVAVFCADNGIVAEGVTQTGSEITAIVGKNLCTADTSVCEMAQVANCDVVPVDVGMLTTVDHPRMVQAAVIKGTKNFKYYPAMTREQVISAMEVGIKTAIELVQEGYEVLITGEMGIGNTTTSSAVGAVLLKQPAEKMTGMGAGLSATGVQHKIKVITEAIALHQPDSNDPIDVLSKVGGLDIAAMAGLCLGTAYCKKVVIIDGFISGIAALIA
ncbi:MAG: nicotinate-nucleotide--dimethylbenzimidazole phosphoribosyltransferase, partial [Eubacteriales bacterium]